MPLKSPPDFAKLARGNKKNLSRDWFKHPGVFCPSLKCYCNLFYFLSFVLERMGEWILDVATVCDVFAPGRFFAQARISWVSRALQTRFERQKIISKILEKTTKMRKPPSSAHSSTHRHNTTALYIQPKIQPYESWLMISALKFK